jgi:hypothetical protein
MPTYLFTVLWATEVFRITEREVQAQVAMYPDEGGEVIRPARNREHADDLRPGHARYRQLKEKIWKGLQEHHLAGWNTGPIPYGYAPDRHPHPNPMKAGTGLTRHKLTADPDTAPWVPQIFEWRILDHLALTAIARRLDEAGAPCPGGRRWSGAPWTRS